MTAFVQAAFIQTLRRLPFAVLPAARTSAAPSTIERARPLPLRLEGVVNPSLRKTADRLDALRTPEGVAIPANALAELRRDTARLRRVEDQIAEIAAAPTAWSACCRA